MILQSYLQILHHQKFKLSCPVCYVQRFRRQYITTINPIRKNIETWKEFSFLTISTLSGLLTDACRTFCIETPHECNRSSHDCFEPRFSENAETSDIIGSECICQSNGFIPSWRIFEIIFQIIFTNWRITDFEIGNFWCHSLRKITLSMFHVPNISLKRTFMKNRRSNWSTRNGYFWD